VAKLLLQVGGRGFAMQTVIKSYRGLSLLVSLNWDRIFVIGTVIVGLLAGAFLGTAIMQPAY
jgi:hypothetical protein